VQWRRAGYSSRGYEGYGELQTGGGITPPKLLSADQSRKPSGITGRRNTTNSLVPTEWSEGEGEIFKAKGLSPEEDSAVLIEQYAGNPLA